MKKVFLSIFIVLIVLLYSVPINAEFLCGDGNGDRSVNILDITVIISYLYNAGPEPYYYGTDVNSDGTINILDITNLINFLYKNGSDLYCLIPPDPNPEITDSSECHFNYLKVTDSTPFDSSCVNYAYDGQGTLTLIHYNVGLNCCPEAFVAEYEIQDSIITIIEIDSVINYGCFCLCLYELSFQLDNVIPGAYTIIFDEPLVGPNEEHIEFTIDLIGITSGRFCVYRNEYPWGIMR